jgi:hypothetical protein
MIPLFVLALLGAANAPAPADPSTPSCDSNTQDCDTVREAAVIKAYPRLFTRNGKNLNLHFANGMDANFLDVDNESDESKHYRAAGVFPSLGKIWLAIDFWEGGEDVLYDAFSGAQTPLAGRPSISPDGKTLLLQSFAGAAEYVPDVLAIYQLAGNSLQPLYSYPFAERSQHWGVCEAAWVDNANIKLRWCNDSINGSRPGNLILKHGHWQLLQPAPKN